MAGQPTFPSECNDAFNMMNTQESPNDYFVCGFDGASHVMKVVEMGKGGMARVKEILKENFSDGTAVAMFRVTAVDDRENTVSYRTKLVHVIYTGPNTPVMKRAKITPFNAAFKQPFTFNLSIQTSDEDGDLTEAAIEKTLRASGGAHQPTRFDFYNSSAPGEGETKMNRRSEGARSPSHAAASPSPTRTAPKSSPAPAAAAPVPEESYDSPDEIMRRHNEAFDARDFNAIGADYARDAKVVHIDASAQKTTVYNGQEEIVEYFRIFIDSQGSSEVSVQNLNTDGNIVTMEWANPGAGYHYGSDVFLFSKGKITLQTITSVAGESAHVEEPQPEGTHAEETQDQAEGASAEWEAVESSEAPATEEEVPATEEDTPAEEEAPAHDQGYEEEQGQDDTQQEDAPAEEQAQDEIQHEDAGAEDEAPADEEVHTEQHQGTIGDETQQDEFA